TAGEYFPQPWAGGSRMDDLLGEAAWLIRRDQLVGRLAPFAGDLSRWFSGRDGEAVLVRPDRYVFGVGEPEALAAAWAARTGTTAALAA
ncbi:MAG TPA: hypothetical protein PLO65_15870, partial [Caulobacter sp.]|nr:hypothetical protein [Caulobacter sp.]